jgi:hypothetical protein
MNLALRDIHLPDPVSWWPPAPGWWLLLLTAIGLGIALSYWWRTRSRRRLLQLAQHELTQIEHNYAQSHDTGRALQQISMLLRRIALSRYPRADVAGLTGERWLQFLDSTLPDRPFTQGSGRSLADAPYRPSAELDIQALFVLCHQWITAQFKNRAVMPAKLDQTKPSLAETQRR